MLCSGPTEGSYKEGSPESLQDSLDPEERTIYTDKVRSRMPGQERSPQTLLNVSDNGLLFVFWFFLLTEFQALKQRSHSMFYSKRNNNNQYLLSAYHMPGTVFKVLYDCPT